MSGFLNDQNQGQQKNMFLAVLLALGVTVVYTSFATPPPSAPVPAAETDGSGAEAAPAEVAPVAAVAPAADGSGEAAPAFVEAEALPALTISGSNHDVSISNVGGRMRGVTVREPTQYVPRESIIGVFPAATDSHFPLSIKLGGLPDLREDSVYSVVSDGAADGTIVMEWTSPDSAIRVTRTYAASDDAFGMSVTVAVENLSSATRRFEGLTTSMYGEFSPEGGGMFNRSASVLEGICAGDFGVERRPARKIEEARTYGSAAETVSFGGVDEQYFMTALMPLEGTTITRCGYEPVDANHMVTRLSSAAFDLAGGATETFAFTLYTGPKHVDYLTPFPNDLNRSIDLGMFSFLAIPIRIALLFFQGWVVNWGLAIIILTLFIKLLLFPITQKGYESMEKMKRVQPRLKVIQTKYESDRMKLAEEQMKLFKEEGVSPMSGCLPMLMQMPIYFALYRTIWGSAELYNAPFMLWVQDLSQPDPFFVLPVLMGAVMVVQQRLMPQAVDNPQMKTVNRIMPIMFTAMMLFLPSGLVLYIFVNMLLSIFQMLHIKKKFSTDSAAPAKS